MADHVRDDQEDAPWTAGWEDQEANTFESSLAATPLQRLEWLEEVLALAWAGQERLESLTAELTVPSSASKSNDR